MSGIFAAAYTPDGTPYWWAERASAAQDSSPEDGLFDALIIGSGFTGVTAAIELATAGQSVLVLDAERVGFGASSRNGGMITGTLNHSPNDLATLVGRDTGDGMSREAAGLPDFLRRQIARFGIDCDLRVVDHFLGASTPKHAEGLAQSMPQYERVGMTMRMANASEQRQQIDTAHYRGGRIHEDCVSLHPAKYHRGLIQTAEALGVRFAENCRVTAMGREGDLFRLTTTRGAARGRQVLVATNGYTSTDLAWYRRRVVPMQSSIIATEELGEERVASLFPKLSVISDTKRILSYFRPSPDGRRVIYGGRASFTPIAHNEIARRLRLMMLQVFPQLAETRITHCWGGFVGFTLDFIPHAGQHEGIDYSLGYCGSGVGMGSWLGYRTARRMLGVEAPSAFEAVPFKTHPGYRGNPWMLPWIGSYFRIRDRIDAALAG